MIETIFEDLRTSLKQAETAGEPDDWKVPVEKSKLRSLVEFWDREHSHIAIAERLVERGVTALRDHDYDAFERIAQELDHDLKGIVL